jgi:hypothetical protein
LYSPGSCLWRREFYDYYRGFDNDAIHKYKAQDHGFSPIEFQLMKKKQDEVFQQQNDHKSLQKIFKTQDKQIAEIAAKNPQRKTNLNLKSKM